jgi:hypothetical protein
VLFRTNGALQLGLMVMSDYFLTYL